MGSCPVQVFKWTRAVLNPLYFSLLPESLDRMSLLTEVAESLKLIADISPNLDCLALQGEWDDLIQAQVKLLGLLSKPQINADANDKATDHQYQNQAIINMDEQPRDNTVGNSVINDVEVSNTAINDVEVGNTAIHNVEAGNSAIDDVEVDNTGINDVEVGNTEIGDVEVGNTEIDDVEVGNTEIADVEVGNTEIDDVEVGDTVEFEVSENGDVINESGDIRTIFAKNWKSGKAANFSNNGGNVLVIADNLDLLKQNEGSRAIAQARSEPITSYIEGAQQQLIFVTGAILESEDKTTDDVCLKVEEDIYVDIVLAPREDSQNSEVDPTQTTNSKDKDNPLNKLCQLLRIDEEEGVDKRCEEFERKRKYENNMPYKYFCTQCSFKAKRENHYQKHLKLHEKHHSLYTCNKCQFRTIRIAMLRRHEMQHNVDRLVNCKLCSYKTDSSKLLVKHFQAKHTGNRRMLRCDECEFKSGSQRDLNVHKRMHDPVKPIEYWHCNQCAYRTQYKGHLGRHKNDMHGEARPFLCHHCGKSFKRHETLKQHKIVHGEVARTYACPHCSKNCRTAGQLKEHMMVHSTHRPILCELCGATFKTRSVYYRHVKKLHSDVSFQCNICKLPFTNKPALVKHARTHRLEDESLIIKKEVTDS